MTAKKKLWDKNHILVVCFSGLLSILMAVKGLSEEVTPYSSELEMTIGKPTAPITMVDYSSLTCPHCATFHLDVFPRIKEEYVDTGKLFLIFREIYFDGPGLWASMLARCSDDEAFFPIIDLLLSKQDDWSRSTSQIDIVNGLKLIGKQAGLSDKEVLTCLKDRDKAKKLVEWSNSNAIEDSVDSTPTILINGKKMARRLYVDLKQEIETYLDD